MQLASLTGWGFKEIMEELPFSAGLQIIDADLMSKGVDLVYVTGTARPDFDSMSLIDSAFKKRHGNGNN